MARTSLNFKVVAAGALLALGVSGCGGGTPAPLNAEASGVGHVSGLVIKGPVSNGQVTAYRLDAAMARGASLATTRTDASGAFELELRQPYSGALLVVVSSGSYTEEALGTDVQVSGAELVTVIPEYRGGQRVDGVRITPLSTLAVAAARHHVKEGVALPAALDAAFAALNATYGVGLLDWRAVTPADLTSPGVTTLTPEARAGLVLAGLSRLAQDMAVKSGLTPGTTINAVSLTAALAADVGADGKLNGMGPAGTLREGTASLDAQTARSALAGAMGRFLESERNKSSLRLTEVLPFLTQLAASTNEYLFLPGGPAPNIDLFPPRITFVRPQANAGVKGLEPLTVRAVDVESKMQSLRVVAPASLASLAPTFSQNGTEATLEGVLDVSAVTDGPFSLEVEAQDEVGNIRRQAINLTVANRGPNLDVTAPADSAIVKELVTVTASASPGPSGAAITKLEVINPPPGLDPTKDLLAAADALAVVWDTTRAPEGPATVTVRATDAFGAFIDKTVRVTVDNREPARVRAIVHAGGAVQGLVVQLLAIDDTSGDPATGRVGGAVLGEGRLTGSNSQDPGAVEFLLTDENYSGTAQLVAFAPDANAFVADPTEAGRNVPVPQSFRFTSYVRDYQAGSTLTRPLTLWTTLADRVALSLAQGQNPSDPPVRTLSVVLEASDRRMAQHVTSRQNAAGMGPVWSVRTTVPTALTEGPRQLSDVVYAAFADVALHQLSRMLATETGLGTAEFSVFDLVSLLQRDLTGDAVFDGRPDVGEQPLRVQGPVAGSSYTLDVDTTRLRLAVALDVFLRSTRNATGITRAGVQTSVLDVMASDTSILYPPGTGPRVFDNDGPTLTLTARFVPLGGDHAPVNRRVPVGTSSFVSGTVYVTAVAQDASGVSAVNITYGQGTPAPRQGTESTPTVYVGRVETGAGTGPLTFTATARDALDNVSSRPLTVRLDNTGPSVIVAANTPADGAVYAVPNGQQLLLEARAQEVGEGAGMKDTWVSVDGVELRRSAGELVTSGWAPPSATDKEFVVEYAAEDLVGNVTRVQRRFWTDRQAPVVTSAIPSARWARPGTWTVLVAAQERKPQGAPTQLASIQGVVSLGNAQVTASCAPASSGACTLTFNTSQLGDGDYTWSVTATDSALSAGNVSAPVTGDVLTIDNTPPAVTVDDKPGDEGSNQGRYCSEQHVRLASPFTQDASSQALTGVGGCVNLGTTTTSVVDRVVYKLANRLRPGALDPNTLERDNPTNTPFVQFSALFSAGSPFQASRYQVRCTAGCADTTSVHGGQMLASPYERFAGEESFDLPLTADYVPQLARVTAEDGKATLELQAYFSDRAGNEGALAQPFVVDFYVVAPPVRVFDDAGYTTQAVPDPYSVWAADHITGYDEYLARDASLRGRVRRIVVSNPWDSEVMVNLTSRPGTTITPALTFREIWGNVTETLPSGLSYSLDGFNFRGRFAWDWAYDVCTCEGEMPSECIYSNSETAPPCSNAGTERAAHFLQTGARTQRFTCTPTTTLPISTQGAARSVPAAPSPAFTTNDFQPQAFVTGTSNNEGSAVAPFGQLLSVVAFRVPARSSITLFATVPRNFRPTDTSQYPAITQAVFAGQDRIQSHWADFWPVDAGDTSPTCTRYKPDGTELATYYTDQFQGWRWYQRLEGTLLSASWDYQVNVRGLSADGALQPAGNTRIPYDPAAAGAPAPVAHQDRPL